MSSNLMFLQAGNPGPEPYCVVEMRHCTHYVITKEFTTYLCKLSLLYMLFREPIQRERQALSASKLFRSLYWFSYITGLSTSALSLSETARLCVVRRYVEGTDKHISGLAFAASIHREENVNRCDVCLCSPWAAGVSGTVEPFQQLRVRRHSNFNHVGVRLHPEGPIMSREQTFSDVTAGRNF